jgi:hypothetical protein
MHQIDNIADDRLVGAEAIAKFRGEPIRRTRYLIERGAIPFGREGNYTANSCCSATARRLHPPPDGDSLRARRLRDRRSARTRARRADQPRAVMIANVRQALAAIGIVIRRFEPGEHRAPCPWCDRGPRDDALAVRIDQDGATWLCHRCGEKGCSRQAQDGSTPGPRPRQQLEPERHETLSSWGRTLWENSRPIGPDTIAGRYLEGRGCLLPLFPDETHLRWHSALSDRVSGYTGPALVALVTDLESAKPINLHRTWLQHDGSGKAPIEKPRRLLKGHRSRGVVRLAGYRSHHGLGGR